MAIEVIGPEGIELEWPSWIMLFGCLTQPEWNYKEVWPCWRKCVTLGAELVASYAQAIPNVVLSRLLPVDQDVELLSRPPAARLPLCHHVFCHGSNGLYL